MVNDSSYEPRAAAAVGHVLKKLHLIFADKGPAIVLVGGSVPAQVCEKGEPHKGTIDLDLVISEVEGETNPPLDFRTRLLRNDFKVGSQENRFVFETDDGDSVPVEFIAGETRWKRSAFIKVGDAKALLVKGGELAYRYNEPIGKGMLRVAAPVAFLCMKAFAASDTGRGKSSKDCYDIVYYTKYYRGGMERIAESITSALGDELVKEGINKLFSLFQTVDSKGPMGYAQFFTDAEKTMLSRHAFETMNELLGMVKTS